VAQKNVYTLYSFYMSNVYTFFWATLYIFVHESTDFNTTPTHHICKEKDLEICTIKLNLPTIKMDIITICRSPTASYNYCLRKLESFLNLSYTKKKNNFSFAGIYILIIFTVIIEDNGLLY